MLGRYRRSVAMATGMALLTGLLAVGPVSAMTPPGGGSGNALCQTVPAGYLGLGTFYNKYGGVKGWYWDGRLQLWLCVVRSGSGAHYAVAQLSSPVTTETYDRFTGLVYVYLESCSTGASIAPRASWSVPLLATGTRSGSRYYFAMIQGNSTTSTSSSGYRVHVQTWVAAVVPRSAPAPVIALSPKGMASGPGTDGNYKTTGCLNP
jgi:hypothetical protein